MGVISLPVTDFTCRKIRNFLSVLKKLLHFDTSYRTFQNSELQSHLIGNDFTLYLQLKVNLVLLFSIYTWFLRLPPFLFLRGNSSFVWQAQTHASPPTTINSYCSITWYSPNFVLTHYTVYSFGSRFIAFKGSPVSLRMACCNSKTWI